MTQVTGGVSWPYGQQFSFASQRDQDDGLPPPTPFTDEQLGFRADDDLRQNISSYDARTSQNALLLQIARISDRILKHIESTTPPASP